MEKTSEQNNNGNNPEKEQSKSLSDSKQENKAESPLTFTRKNIENYGPNIRLVDSDESTGLDLFCYTHCGPDDDEFVKKSRGIVFNGENLVMQAFPYTPEYNGLQVKELENVLSDFSKWSFYDSYEGTLLRMFYFDKRWFLSTHRKLNAFRSKWASRESFGTLFKRGLEAEIKENSDFAKRVGEGDNVLSIFENTLDKDKQYMFLLCSSDENRIVCQPPPRPTIFHVGTFVDKKLTMDVDCGLPYPTKHNFLNIDELLHHVNNRVHYRDLQGVVCFGPENVQVKVLHIDYQDLYKARGNEPSIKFQYLKVRMDRKMTDMLYHLYPNMSDVFDEYENYLYEIAQFILKSYIERFIRKQHVTVPHEEYQVIKECHSWYLSDRQNHRISLNKVIEFLNKQPPTNLNHMIRRLKLDQLKKEEGFRPRSYEGSPVINPQPVKEPVVLKTNGIWLPPPAKK